LDLLRQGADGKAGRIAELDTCGYPAYTTTPAGSAIPTKNCSISAERLRMLVSAK